MAKHGLLAFDTREPMSWDDIRYLLAIARAGSLSRAARLLGIDHATLSRRLAAVEKARRTKLFERSRAGVIPTPAGVRVLELARIAEDNMLAVEHQLEGLDAEEGPVRVATSNIFATVLLAPHLAGFARRHARIGLELFVSRGLVSFARNEADLALRSRPPGSPLAEPSVVTALLSKMAWAAYATADAPAGACVRYPGARTPGLAWLEQHGSARAPSVIVDDAPSACALARAGFGAAVLPCFVADPLPELRRVSGILDYHRLVVAMQPALRAVRRVTLVVEWLRDTVARERRRLDGRG